MSQRIVSFIYGCSFMVMVILALIKLLFYLANINTARTDHFMILTGDVLVVSFILYLITPKKEN